MKFFITNKGQKLEKTSKFKIIKITDAKEKRSLKLIFNQTLFIILAVSN